MNEIIKNINIETFSIIDKFAFSPLILIGLLITSLSLILNLKDSNQYIKNFKQHPNMPKFIDKIYTTSIFLIIMIFIYIIFSFIDIFVQDKNSYTLLVMSIGYFVFLSIVINHLYNIVYILKEIVRTSLQDDK